MKQKSCIFHKSFTRFHINSDGDLEVYTLAVDKVPKEWKLDPDWDGETKHPHELSHLRRFPSKWRAAIAHQDPVRTVKIVDHFVIGRTDKNDCATTAPNGPVQ